MKLCKLLPISGLVLSATVGVRAAPVVLTFEGVGDLQQVANFYNGSGGPSLNLGVSFGPLGLGLVDQDVPAGQTPGSGVFANEPSPSTVLTFPAGGAIGDIVLNYPAGFIGGFSTYYVSTDDAFVRAWSGPNGTGAMLAELHLEDQKVTGPGDPLPVNGTVFGVWDIDGTTFEGTALSVTFTGSRTIAAFDNVTLGSAVPGLEQSVVATSVPEPTTGLLTALGLAGLCLARTRRG